MPSRRRLLAGVGGIITSTALGGCSESIPTRSEPELYPEDIRYKLILTEADFPEGWTYSSEQSDENIDAFINGNETKLVGVSVEINDSISEAKNQISNQKESFRRPEDIDIANEAFWDTQDSYAQTYFRHINVIGYVAAIQRIGLQAEPRVSTSHNYAREMFNKWRNEYPSATSE